MHKARYSRGLRFLVLVLLAAFLSCRAVTLGADDSLRFRMRVTFSDEKVFYGDVFFAKIEISPLDGSLASVEQTTIENVVNYYKAARPADPLRGTTVIKVSGSEPIVVMLRAIGSWRLAGEPSVEVVNDVLRVVQPPVDPSMLLPGLQQDVSEPVWIEPMFGWKRSFPLASKLPTQGPIERSIGSIYRIPVRGFAFVAPEIREINACIRQVHYAEQDKPALIDADSFPLDLAQWNLISSKIERRSNLAQLIANSRSFALASSNQQLTDDQFLRACVTLVEHTKPIACDWLSHAIERNLSASRPELVASYRQRVAQSTK